tara:strand:- start:207 stop:590 length:384 start_codon:yes stop_codon:yes gene_type:complete
MKLIKALSSVKLEAAYIRTWMLCTTLIIYFFYVSLLLVLHCAHEAGTSAPVVSIAIVFAAVSLGLLVFIGVGGFFSAKQVTDAYAGLEEGLVALREGQYGRRIHLPGHPDLEKTFNDTAEFLQARYG